MVNAWGYSHAFTIPTILEQTLDIQQSNFSNTRNSILIEKRYVNFTQGIKSVLLPCMLFLRSSIKENNGCVVLSCHKRRLRGSNQWTKHWTESIMGGRGLCPNPIFFNFCKENLQCVPPNLEFHTVVPLPPLFCVPQFLNQWPPMQKGC